MRMTDAELSIRLVRSAYQWILGRDPDAEGLWKYAREISSGEMDEGRLRHIFLNSEEFELGRFRLEKVKLGERLWAIVDRNDPEFGRSIAANGTWEAHIVETIRRTLKPGDVFVDVGANIGVMSFNAAEVVGPGGRVISFEPHPRNVNQFLRGVVANDFKQIQLYPFALSDQRRVLKMSSGSNSKASIDVDPLQIAEVAQAVAGDSLLLEEPRLDLMKIDIEGHEALAISGLRQTLARHRPKVLCEFNPLCLRNDAKVEPSILSDMIFELTSIVTVIEHSDRRCEVRSTSELMDLWRRRDAHAVESGHLPKGWVHFDLLFQVE
jgi:FkbM family methyltransferase